MKKCFNCLFVSIAIVFTGFAGVYSIEKKSLPSSKIKQYSSPIRQGEKTMKSAIIFYSYTGNTEVLAQALSKNLGIDVFKIEDIKRPSTLKAYIMGAYAARKELSWPIKPVQFDISKYNRIFIGAPIWWGKTAPELNSFIQQTDFKDKSIVIFVTAASSQTDEAIAALNKKITAKGGKVISSFAVKTMNMKREDLVSRAEEIAKQY